MPSSARQAHLEQAFLAHYGAPPTVWVRAPGRVDLMGSHTDYNQGFVLTLPINRDTWIAACPRADALVRVHSLNTGDGGTFSLNAIDHDRRTPWTNYVRGVAHVLQREGIPLSGCDCLVHSTVPLSSGLSSSAALEAATAILFGALGGWTIDPVRLALLCQQAENDFVGVNCGILDQYTSILGQAGCALLLDCRDLSSRPVTVPTSVRIVICDTRAPRELKGSEYGERRAQCEEGARRLARFYPDVRALRDVSLEQLLAHLDDLPPLVARRCRFIIEENARVLQLAEALPAADGPAIAALTTASYAGACELYEICSREMEAMFSAMISAPGAIGARQAGAGFGGCMVAFVQAEAASEFERSVRQAYATITGIAPEVYPVQPAAGAEVIVRRER